MPFARAPGIFIAEVVTFRSPVAQTDWEFANRVRGLGAAAGHARPSPYGSAGLSRTSPVGLASLTQVGAMRHNRRGEAPNDFAG